jgi:hypothetical protein
LTNNNQLDLIHNVKRQHQCKVLFLNIAHFIGHKLDLHEFQNSDIFHRLFSHGTTSELNKKSLDTFCPLLKFKILSVWSYEDKVCLSLLTIYLSIHLSIYLYIYHHLFIYLSLIYLLSIYLYHLFLFIIIIIIYLMFKICNFLKSSNR